jgi:hypothetical protein
VPDCVVIPSSGSSPYMFGAALAARGNHLLIGAPYRYYAARQDEGITPPVAALFAHADSGWTRTALVHGADPAAAEGFGRAVALTERLAIVGAPGHEGGDGATHLFARDGTGLQPNATLDPPGQDPLSDVLVEYGVAVASDDEWLVVGAPLTFDRPPGDPNGAPCGAIYMFDLRHGAPVLAYTRPGTLARESFGATVALSGKLIAVGAPGSYSNEQSAGAVYLLSRAPDGALHEVCRLAGCDPGEEFGASMALNGHQLAVGAPGRADLQRPVGGRVDLFEIGDAACRRAASFSDAPGFGKSVAMLGGRLAVGQPEWDAPDGTPRAGRVALLRVDGSSSFQHDTWLAASVTVPYARLGSAVALGPDYVAAGAPGLGEDDDWAGFVLTRAF